MDRDDNGRRQGSARRRCVDQGSHASGSARSLHGAHRQDRDHRTGAHRAVDRQAWAGGADGGQEGGGGVFGEVATHRGGLAAQRERGTRRWRRRTMRPEADIPDEGAAILDGYSGDPSSSLGAENVIDTSSTGGVAIS